MVQQKNKRGPVVTVSNAYGFGKLPPHAIDVEEIVLGALLQENGWWNEVSDLLHAELFYKEAHKFVFEAMYTLKAAGDPIDLITVTHQLKRSGNLDLIGGPFFLTSLTQRVAGWANMQTWCLILKEKFIRRSLIQMSGNVMREAYEDTSDVFEVLGLASTAINDISHDIIRGKMDTGYSLGNSVLKEIENRGKTTGFRGVASGYDQLDQITMGWQDSNLIIIAGRPAMGKTAMAINCAINAIHFYKRKIGVFSLEMSSEELLERIIASETGIPGEKIKSGKGITEEEKIAMANVIIEIGENILLDDEGGITITELKAKSRRMKHQFDVQMLIVDYLQLLKGTKQYHGNRESEISEISRELKALAKELQIPIIALSQLSRETEKRQNKRPQLSDLRESGAIEQDADMVVFLYRPNYYGVKAESSEGDDMFDVAEVIIAKQRSGSLGTAILSFSPHITKFSNYQSKPKTIISKDEF